MLLVHLPQVFHACVHGFPFNEDIPLICACYPPEFRTPDLISLVKIGAFAQCSPGPLVAVFLERFIGPLGFFGLLFPFFEAFDYRILRQFAPWCSPAADTCPASFSATHAQTSSVVCLLLPNRA